MKKFILLIFFLTSGFNQIFPQTGLFYKDTLSFFGIFYPFNDFYFFNGSSVFRKISKSGEIISSIDFSDGIYQTGSTQQIVTPDSCILSISFQSGLEWGVYEPRVIIRKLDPRQCKLLWEKIYTQTSTVGYYFTTICSIVSTPDSAYAIEANSTFFKFDKNGDSLLYKRVQFKNGDTAITNMVRATDTSYLMQYAVKQSIPAIRSYGCFWLNLQGIPYGFKPLTNPGSFISEFTNIDDTTFAYFISQGHLPAVLQHCKLSDALPIKTEYYNFAFDDTNFTKVLPKGIIHIDATVHYLAMDTVFITKYNFGSPDFDWEAAIPLELTDIEHPGAVTLRNSRAVYDPFEDSYIVTCSISTTTGSKFFIIKITGDGKYVTKIVDNSSVIYPATYRLSQNYPNPFNPETVIKYSVSSPGYTTLKVFNLLGKEVAKLTNEYKHTGDYEVKFSGTNLPSGIYFYTFRSGNFSETKKLMLIK